MDLIYPSRRAELEKELYESACAGFNREQTNAFETDVANHLREGILYVALQNKTAVGFAVLRDFPEILGVYIAGVVKNPKAPSGIIEKIVKYHIGINDCEVVVVRTQNDRVVEIMKSVCRMVVPIDREAGQEEFEILRTMGLLGANVGPDLVARSHYGGEPMISREPRRRSKNREVERTTDRLNYEEGDALLAVGYRC